MTLKEMWKKYLELDKKGNELYDKGEKLYDKGEKAESWKVEDEAYKLWDEAAGILNGFVDKNYGIGIDYGDEESRITLSNGIILYYDGRVYEPLDVVMRKIIKKHEEKKK